MPRHRIEVKDTSPLHALDQGTPVPDKENVRNQRDSPSASQSSQDVDVSQMVDSLMKSVRMLIACASLLQD